MKYNYNFYRWVSTNNIWELQFICSHDNWQNAIDYLNNKDNWKQEPNFGAIELRTEEA